MSPPRISIHIDTVVCDAPGLSRVALEQALQQEISETLAREGHAALGNSREVRTRDVTSAGSTAQDVARATLKALRT